MVVGIVTQRKLEILAPAVVITTGTFLRGLIHVGDFQTQAGRYGDKSSQELSPSLTRIGFELGRLKTVLRAMELRLAPGGGPGTTPSPRTPFDAALQDVQSVLMPAVRRNQLEWHLAAPAGESVVVALRPEDSFDLLAALAIIAIEGAPARSVLELTTIREGDRVLLAIGHAGSPQASFALELPRELLRVAATHAGGSVDWQQSARGAVARLALPCAIG